MGQERFKTEGSSLQLLSTEQQVEKGGFSGVG